MDFVSLGAGVQSTVLLLMAEAGEIEPRPQGSGLSGRQAETPRDNGIVQERRACVKRRRAPDTLRRQGGLGGRSATETPRTTGIVRAGGPTWMVGGTVFEMWLGAL